MAEEDNAEGTEQTGGGMMQKLMLGGGALLLVIVGVVAGPAVMNMVSPPDEESTAETEEADVSGKPEIYTSLHPPLVINFKDSLGDDHFMQVTLEVMARDQGVINAVREHAAVIRNDLILLYTSVIYEEVTTREGKEQMLADGLAEVQKIMGARLGDGPNVEALYFTALVIQ